MKLLKECAVCGSRNFKFLFKAKDRLHKTDNQLFNVYQCCNCGLGFLNPQPLLSELEKYYPENYGPHQVDDQGMIKHGLISSFLKKVIYNKVNNFIKNKKQKDNNVKLDLSVINYLDYGCGSGKQMELVRKKHPNWNIYGYDINESACQRVEQRGFRIIRDGGLNNFKSYFFDKINMSHVVEHLNNPKVTIIELYNMMKTKGEIIISTPNFESWGAKIFRSYWYSLDVPRHLFLFNPNNLSKMLRDIGFELNGIKHQSTSNVEIKSIFYFLGKKDLRINPILWRMVSPITSFAAYRGKASVMIFNATKNN